MKTTIGSSSALMEQRCNGRYSSGEFHSTRLKMIAAMPEKDKMPNTIVLTIIERFLRIKYKPITAAAAKAKLSK